MHKKIAVLLCNIKVQKKPRATDGHQISICTSPAGGSPVTTLVLPNFRHEAGGLQLRMGTSGIPKTNCGLKKGDCQIAQGP